MRCVPTCAFLVSAFSLAGCFRIAQGGPDDVGTNASGVDCVYGKIASVPGLPLGIASTGKTIFVVSSDVGGVIGDLTAITSDGSTHRIVVSNAYIGMAALGSSLAFNRRQFDRENNFVSATVELVNPDLSTTTIDATSSEVAQVDSLTTDGTSLYWYRWAPSSDSFDTGIYGTPTIAKYDGKSISTTTFEATTPPQGLVTDGADFFWINDDYQALGIDELPVAGGSLVVLSQGEGQLPFESMIGVDETNVIAQGSGSVWAIPKNGSTPTQITSGTAFGSTPVLYDHDLVWAVQNADGTGSVSHVSTSGGAVETVASSKSPIPIVTTDACGVVYATTDSADPGLTAASIFRAEF
jgi:hypothetical protein